MKVKFSDVVRRANTKEDRFNTDKEFYVGGEHMITGEYLITRRGTIAGSNIGPMFYFGFKKGQVLLASRSPDLKKAGMVTFDGICSEKTFVIETKDESVLLQDFLPAIVRSESFWKYANDNQSGSVNHFINWTTFANYEFDLPDIETQRKLSALLWAMERTKTAYKNLIAKTDELVKSQFVEMFGEFKRNTKGWPVLPFEKFATIDANMTTDYEKYADYPHIGIDSIEKETGELKGYRTVKDDGVISGKYVFTPEHIIYSKIRPNLNKVALPSFCGLCSADAYPILPNPDVCSRTFLAYVMRSAFFLDYILQFSARSNMPKVNRKEIAGFKSPMPPLTMQKEFETFVAQADKSKFAAQQALADLTGAQKALMRQYLG